MKMQAGQTMLGLVMWGTGISVTVGGLSYGIISAKFSQQDSKIYQQAQDISSLNAKAERIPVIENKLDALLINRGINPDKLKN